MEMVMDNLTRYAASVATKERSRKQILRKKKLGARAALVRSLRCVICHAPTKIDIEKTDNGGDAGPPCRTPNVNSMTSSGVSLNAVVRDS